MPLVCCCLKATTPPTTADCEVPGTCALNVSLDASFRCEEEPQSTLWERLRTVCCVAEQVRILGAAGVMDRARSADRRDEAVRFLISAGC